MRTIFRVSRDDWTGTPEEDSQGHPPITSFTTWHSPPGEWRIEAVSLDWLVSLAQRHFSDFIIRPAIRSGELPTLIVVPWPDTMDLLRPRSLTVDGR